MAPAVPLDALLAPMLAPASAEAWGQLVHKSVAPALLHGKPLVVELPDDMLAMMQVGLVRPRGMCSTFRVFSSCVLDRGRSFTPLCTHRPCKRGLRSSPPLQTATWC